MKMEERIRSYEPIFGSWHVSGPLGEGSYGNVFEIEKTDIGGTYKSALKVVTVPRSHAELQAVMDNGMDEEEAKAYFHEIVETMTREFNLMDKLKGNSYIVSYEDHDVREHEDGMGWDILIRMELLTPLHTWLKKNPMTEQDIVRFGIDMCHALEACAKQQIIHRDIKPENIFYSNGGTFKLGDFGVAKAEDRTSGALTHTGTDAYIAPEVQAGEKYDFRVDIYSLGLVLYRYLNNNRLPFFPPYPEKLTYASTIEAQAKRLSGLPVPPPARASKAVADVLLKACAFKPKDRYHSATKMREALEKALEAIQPLPQKRDETVYEAPKIYIRKELIVAAVAVMAAVVLGFWFFLKPLMAPGSKTVQAGYYELTGVTGQEVDQYSDKVWLVVNDDLAGGYIVMDGEEIDFSFQKTKKIVLGNGDVVTSNIEGEHISLQISDETTMEFEKGTGLPPARPVTAIQTAPQSDDTGEGASDTVSQGEVEEEDEIKLSKEEIERLIEQAIALSNGYGTVDYDKAIEMLEKAASAGSDVAMNELGCLYYDKKKDYDEAAKWFRKAANRGNGMASYNLGLCYYWGNGVEKSHHYALTWYKKAAARGDANAMINLGYMHQVGEGVRVDYEKALEWYIQAADNGNKMAVDNIQALVEEHPEFAEKAGEWIEEESSFRITVTKSEVLVRESATTSSKAFAKLNKGMMFTVLGVEIDENGMEWYKIEYKKQTGYIRSDMAEKKKT